jgi:subtilase family serine protease
VFNTEATDLIDNDLNGSLDDVFVFGAAANPLPDLIISDLIASSTPANKPATYKVSLAATVENIGVLQTKNVKVKFEFSTDSGFSKIGGAVTTGKIPIPGGGSVDVTKQWNNRPEGDYTIRITADPGGRITESDETNNVSIFVVTVP